MPQESVLRRRTELAESALVIEDVPLMANAICRHLRLSGGFGTLRVAGSVTAAVEAMREMPKLRFATVDLTLEGEGEGGFRVLENLRHHRPDALAAIVTGSYDPIVRKRAKRLGVAILPKPFLAGAMRRLVDRALAWPIPWEATAHVVMARSREWGLTRAEHRVLCWKLAGRDGEAYRAEAGLAVSTFGYYLKEITRKAGWERGWTDLEGALLRDSLTATQT